MSRDMQWKVVLLGVSALVLVAAVVFASWTKGAPDELYPELREKDAFAQQAMEALRATGITGELTYDPERFLIQSSTPDGGVGMVVFLSNFHSEYLTTAPGQRGTVLARLGRAGVLPEGSETYAQARPHLMRVVRSRGSEDAEGLLEVAEAAMAGLKAPRPVDGRALRLTAEGWRPFLPEPGSPSRSLLENLAFASQVRGYQEQTERLRRQHEKEGSQLHVAGYLPEQDAKGRFFGQALWSNDGETLLPRADVILFMDAALGPDAPPVASVRWDLVVRDAGMMLMPEPGLYPERYRVRGFPSKELLRRWKSDPTAMDLP